MIQVTQVTSPVLVLKRIMTYTCMTAHCTLHHELVEQTRFRNYKYYVIETECDKNDRRVADETVARHSSTDAI